MSRRLEKEPGKPGRGEHCYFCKRPEVVRVGETKLCEVHLDLVNQIAGDAGVQTIPVGAHHGNICSC